MEFTVSHSLMKDSLLDRVARSKAHFKSQQQGENDLTFEEKKEVAQNLLDHDLVLFLQRFHKYLLLEDLEFFEHYSDSYEVKFYIGEIQKQHDSNKRAVQVKNRRYEAMQRLINSGEYFNDIAMRERMPHLYNQMIGQFLTEAEKREIEPLDSELSFAGFLLKTIEKGHEEDKRLNHKDAEEAADAETDSESDEDDEMTSTQEDLSQNREEDDDGVFPKPIIISREEKDMLRQEFINIMFERFLSGNDQYDYSAIDDNAELDSVQLRQIDEEEKYFDSEEPS